MNLRLFTEDLCPPAMLRYLKKATGRATRFSGPFPTWTAAMSGASGYDSDVIFERVLAATRKVVSGAAAYERDSVLFDRVDDPFQLLAPMLRAALEHGGRLSVLDYGGSLGSTYRRCRSYLAPAELSWSVVEQPRFVAAGKAELEDGVLRFFDALEEIPAASSPNVALFSSVLQYLDDPFVLLERATAGQVRYLIIDRTPFLAEGEDDQIYVQHVPQYIYPASYAFRVFSSTKFLREFAGRWSVLSTFGCPEGRVRISEDSSFEFRGLVLRKNDAQ